MIYVQWERPRRWSVKLYGSREPTGYRDHVTVGIVALSVDRAIAEAQRLYATYRVDSVNDTGEVTSVVDAPDITTSS